MNIYQSLAEINKEIGVIGKNQKNQQQGFQYRGIDDVMNELHSLFAKHEVLIIPEAESLETEERTNANGKVLIWTRQKINYTFFASDGSSIKATVFGEGMDSGDKGANKSMSIALKYVLLQMFLIPTEEEKDPDSQSHQVATKKAEPKKITEDQLNQILDLAINYDQTTLDKVYQYAKVSKFEDLTEAGAAGLIVMLKKKNNAKK